MPVAYPAATVATFATSAGGDASPILNTAPTVIGVPGKAWISGSAGVDAACLGLRRPALLIRLVSASAHTMALKRRTEPADDALRTIVSTLASRIGVTRQVRVLISTMTTSPATVGWLKPVIFLPPATALGVTADQLEALIAHELAHVRATTTPSTCCR